MALIFKVLAFIVMLGVVGALIAGLRNMMKNGSGNYSNNMMQLRVLLQAVAIALLVGALYFSRR
jgi:hypothetical protein